MRRLAPTLLSGAVMESRKFRHDKTMNVQSPDSPDAVSLTPAPLRAGPQLSLVLLSDGRREMLAAVLNSVVPLCQDRATTVFVVLESEALARELGIGHPEVRFLMVGAGLPVAERRATGLRAAPGDVVVFADEGEVDGGRWREALRRQMGGLEAPPGEPSPEWAVRLTQRGIPGALGDI